MNVVHATAGGVVAGHLFLKRTGDNTMDDEKQETFTTRSMADAAGLNALYAGAVDYRVEPLDPTFDDGDWVLTTIW